MQKFMPASKVQHMGHALTPISNLAFGLDAGGFEQYFLRPSGADVMWCVRVLEDASYNIDIELAALLWEAIALVGIDTDWDDPQARKRAIASLSNCEREQLEDLGVSLLDCLYDEGFITDF